MRANDETHHPCFDHMGIGRKFPRGGCFKSYFFKCSFCTDFALISSTFELYKNV